MTVENNVTQLAPPSYFAARDPDLLFDRTLFIDKNEKHVVQERASRLVAAGVLDIEELVYWQEKTPGATPPGLQADQCWDLLRDEDLIKKPPLQMLINGSKTNVYLLMTRNNGRHDHYVYVFRRGDQGLRSACIAMQAWIEESEKRCKQTFSLAVPQIYFTKRVPDLSKGDKVDADARDASKWYAGKITEDHGDGTYDIVFDDWEGFKVDKVLIRKPGAPPGLTSFSKGDKIEGNHQGRGKLYPGTISKDHGDGTYDIIYDGEHETRVSKRLIRSKELKVFVSKKQMILPLFCGTSKAVLALTLDYIAHPPHGAPLAPDPTYPRYRVGTVLTKRMGRGNARLITTPQVPWLNEPP